MKVIRKQKELVVIHIDNSARSYIEIGNYISLNRMSIDNERDYYTGLRNVTFKLKCDKEKEVLFHSNDYIVIDPEDTNNVQVISKEEFERDFIQIAEGGPKDDM